MKKLLKDIKHLTTSGAVLGVGTQVVSRVGGPTAGMTNLAKFQGVTGTMAGAGAVMRALPKLKKKRK